MTQFHEQIPETLGADARTTISRSLDVATPFIQDAGGTPDTRQEQVWAVLTMLAACETEMSYALSDTQQRVRALSERAFAICSAFW
jgi:hypothetical protein